MLIADTVGGQRQNFFEKHNMKTNSHLIQIKEHSYGKSRTIQLR